MSRHQKKWTKSLLQTAHYAGKKYQVTDPLSVELRLAERWNRDVFRLMVALASQVTVDISKFQRQVLQLLPTP